MNIAVMGAGAVGCYYGAMLARAGHAVTLIGRPQHVEVVRRSGLRLEMRGFDGFVAMEAATGAAAVAGADIVLFCVKSGDTETAGREMLPHLAPDAVVLSLQNGVDNAERLAAVIGRPVVPVVVYVATEMAGPGHLRHHGRGELGFAPSPRSEAIAALFSGSGIPSAVAPDAVALLWEKLVLNCAYNALSAVPQLPYGKVVAVQGVSAVIGDIVAECCNVAEACGVTLSADLPERVRNLPASMPTQASSTAQDLARGKPSEIDYLNGFVMRKGAEHGIPTPANGAVTAMVRLMEASRARPGA